MQLDYDNPDLQQYMVSAMKYWLTNFDIDGFRCDMAHLVPTAFWNKTNSELNSVKPVFMLAESEQRDLLETAFDAEYSWKIFHIINEIAQGERNVFDLMDMISDEIDEFPKNSYQMLFTSNHDENSWKGSAIERLGIALETVNILIFTLAGIPLIYNGQEAGLLKRLSFFDKDLIEWKEDKMTTFYKRLIQLRKRNSAIWSGGYGGELEIVESACSKNVFSFIRHKNNDIVIVIINLSSKEQEVLFESKKAKGVFLNIFSHEKVLLTSRENLSLPAWGFRVYEKIIINGELLMVNYEL